MRQNLKIPMLVMFTWLACHASGQQLTALSWLPGDSQIEASVGTQDRPQIAAGANGYLAVWDDKRAVLEATSATPTGVMLQGNGFDIYGALLDVAGQVIKSPIVITNQGRNQTRPQVAWNGQHYLVVWTSERPDWYFYTDIMGIRVTASGELVDAEPFVIRPHYEVPFQPNDYAQNPRLASDGTNWVVVMQDTLWVPSPVIPGSFVRRPTIAAVRIAPDGALIDPQPVVIHQHDSASFGPTVPDVAFGGDQYFVVWDGMGEMSGQRVDFALNPLGPTFEIALFSSNPRVASDGTDFLVVTGENRGFRVTHDGVVLDAVGIDFDAGGQMSQPSGPALAWDGAKYTIAFGSGATAFTDSDLFVATIGTDGSLTGPTNALHSADFEWKASAASLGGGAVQIVLTARNGTIREDIRTVQIAADGAVGAAVETSVGQHRQAYLRFSSNSDEHLAVFVSDGGGLRRIAAQRMTSAGAAIDTEPLILTTIEEPRHVEPDVAFNGTHHLVVWVNEFGSILGQRVGADGTLIDPSPVELIQGDAASSGQIAVGALADTFFVAYTHQVSGDLQYLKGARIASDLTVLDVPDFVAFNFANDPRLVGFGDRWMLVWENQTRHDQSTSSATGKFIEADGTVGASFSFDTGGLGDDPDVAVGGAHALVTWWDTTTIANTRLIGRLIQADGSFLTGEILIADANNDQRQPAVGWDGNQYVVAWMDLRTVNGVEHERADIYAARVASDGTVIDPGGFALTESVLPEELPDVAGFAGTTMIGFSILHGETEPEVQRIGFRILTDALDQDSDGVADDLDNCLLHANPDQRDTNGDGYGNACDPDLNGDGVVNAVDLGMLKGVFFSADPDADFDGNGFVNTVDLGVMRTFFFQAPGPSGIVP